MIEGVKAGACTLSQPLTGAYPITAIVGIAETDNPIAWQAVIERRKMIEVESLVRGEYQTIRCAHPDSVIVG